MLFVDCSVMVISIVIFIVIYEKIFLICVNCVLDLGWEMKCEMMFLVNIEERVRSIEFVVDIKVVRIVVNKMVINS